MVQRPPLAPLLDALGLYFEHNEASDILIQQTGDSVLIGFLTANDQRYVHLDASKLARLQSEASRKRRRSLDPRGSRRENLRARLHALGNYLDDRYAASVVIQERNAGFAIEYTSVPDGAIEPAGLLRLHATIDDSGVATTTRRYEPLPPRL